MGGAIAYLREFNFISMLLRLMLAMLSGGLIGYGRAKKRRNAGFRTYMLTCTGAALSILLALYEYEMLERGSWAVEMGGLEMRYDVSRFSAQVISGIGFLAAGTILAVSHQLTNGLTSATGLFASVCMGIAAGAGFYECVLISLGLIIFALEGMIPLEAAFKRRIRNITIHVEFSTMQDIEEISGVIREGEAQIFDINLERTERKGKNAAAIFTLKLSKNRPSHSEILSSIAELPCVHAVQELIA